VDPNHGCNAGHKRWGACRRSLHRPMSSGHEKLPQALQVRSILCTLGRFFPFYPAWLASSHLSFQGNHIECSFQSRYSGYALNLGPISVHYPNSLRARGTLLFFFFFFFFFRFFLKGSSSWCCAECCVGFRVLGFFGEIGLELILFHFLMLDDAG
jgi:hypothetical protein